MLVKVMGEVLGGCCWQGFGGRGVGGGSGAGGWDGIFQDVFSKL